MRRILIAVGGALAVAVAAVAIAALLIPAERVGTVVAARAEAMLEQPVAIGAIGLDFLPRPGVSLSELEVGGPEPAVTVARLRIRPRLLPLFVGRFVVDEIVVDRPRLVFAFDAAGTPNLALPTDTTTAPQPSDRDIAFAVRSLTISDGLFTFQDARDGTRVVVDGYDQELSLTGAVESGALARIALEGRVAVDSIAADAPALLAVPVRGLRLTLRHDAELDRARDVLTVAELGLEFQQLVLEGSGRVTNLSEDATRRVDLEFATQPFDPLDLLRSVPGVVDAASPGAPIPDVSGTTAIAVRVEGPASSDTLPEVTGTVTLDGVTVARGGVQVLRDFGGTVRFSLHDVATEGLRGRLFGAPFRLAFRARDPAEPVLDFRTEGAIDLDRAAALAPLPDGVSLGGRVSFVLSGAVEPLMPETARLDGTVRLDGLTAVAPGLLQPVSVSRGRVELDGGEMRVQADRLGWGESGLDVDATVRGWLPFALGDSTTLPHATFDIRAGILDLDALLPEKAWPYAPVLFARLRGREIGGRAPEEVAAELGMGLPPLPPVRAEGRFRADRVVRRLAYEDVDAVIRVSPVGLEIPRARLGLMGGTVGLGVRLAPVPGGAVLAGEYRLTDVGAEPFFDTFTPLQGHLAGSMGLDGSFDLELDSLLLPVRTSIRADGTVALTGGRLANWDALRKLGDRLELARFDTLEFDDWRGGYRMVGPLITLDESRMIGPDMEATVGGSIDLGGRLDLGATFRLDQELAAGAARPIRQLVRAAGDRGRVPVGITIRGPIEDPSVALDLSAVRENLAERAREAAERRVAEEAEAARRRAAEAAERVLPDSVRVPPLDSLEGLSPDSLRALYGDSLAAVLGDALQARADSIKRAVADSLANRIRRLIPPLLQEP